MICLGVVGFDVSVCLFCLHLSCLVFSEFPRSMIWCGYYLGKLSVIIVSNISSVSFSLFSSGISITCMSCLL